MATTSPHQPQTGFPVLPQAASSSLSATTFASNDGFPSFSPNAECGSISGSTMTTTTMTTTLGPSVGSSASASTLVNASQESLRDLFHKRLHSFTYLKRTLSGKQAWFDIVIINQLDVAAAFDHERLKKRTARFTLLGISLSSILELSNPADMARAVVSLLNELEGYTDDTIGNLVGGGGWTGGVCGGGGGGGNSFGTTKPKMKNFFKSSSKTLKRSAASQALSDFSSLDGASGSSGMGTGLSMSIGAAGGGSSIGGLDRDYSYLVTPNIPFQLDFFQTFFTLCDILGEIYHKLLSFIPSATGAGPATLGFPQHVQATAVAAGGDSSFGSLSGSFGGVGTSSMNSVNGSTTMLSSPPFTSPTSERDRSTSISHLDAAAGMSSSYGFSLSPPHGESSFTFDKPVPLSATTQDLLIKADAKVKKLLNQTVKEIDTLARQLIKDEISSLDPLMKELGLPPSANSAFVHHSNHHHPNGSSVASPTYSSSPGSYGLPSDYGGPGSILPFSLSQSQTGTGGSSNNSGAGGGAPGQRPSRKFSSASLHTSMQGGVAQKKQLFSNLASNGSNGAFTPGHQASAASSSSSTTNDDVQGRIMRRKSKGSNATVASIREDAEGRRAGTPSIVGAGRGSLERGALVSSED